MRASIDREQCISCGSCWAICPEFFEQNPEDSLSQVVAKYAVEGDLGVGEASDTLQDCVTQAADACPVSIIHLERMKGEHSYGP